MSIPAVSFTSNTQKAIQIGNTTILHPDKIAALQQDGQLVRITMDSGTQIIPKEPGTIDRGVRMDELQQKLNINA